MRRTIFAGTFFTVIVLISAFLSANAFAAPEFLDGTVVGLTFTGKFAKTTELVDPSNGLSIKCNKNLILLATSKVTSSKTIETNIHFEECKENLFGEPVNSLGDTAGIILVPLKGEQCYFDKGETKLAYLLKIPPLHLEVPVLGQLLEIIKNGTNESAVVAKLAANQQNTLKTGPYTLEIAKPNQKECFLGGVTKKTDIVLESNHNGLPLSTEQVGNEEITFDQDIEMMA